MSAGHETPEEKKEAAASRRRWITLGEILAVLAVLISGLTLWNSYSDRNADKIERAAEKQQEKAVSRTLLLIGKGDGRSLALAPHDPAQAIQSQTIRFPTPLGVGAIETLVEPRIEASWVKAAVKKARGAEAGNGRGDARLPVAITTSFVSGGQTLTDTALYDVGYRSDDGGLLGGTEIELRGLSLVSRSRAARAQADLDALWSRRNPPRPKGN